MLKNINDYEASLPSDMTQTLVTFDFSKGSNMYTRWFMTQYMNGISVAAADKPLLGYYLKYMERVYEVIQGGPGRLKEDRFLTHFSDQMAATGLPPVAPALTKDVIASYEFYRSIQRGLQNQGR